MDFPCQYFYFTPFPLFWCYSPSKRKIIAVLQMVINSSGIVAVCCLIMYQDVISLSGTIMLHYISSFYHIKKLRSLLTRTLAVIHPLAGSIASLGIALGSWELLCSRSWHLPKSSSHPVACRCSGVKGWRTCPIQDNSNEQSQGPEGLVEALVTTASQPNSPPSAQSCFLHSHSCVVPEIFP